MRKYFTFFLIIMLFSMLSACQKPTVQDKPAETASVPATAEATLPQETSALPTDDGMAGKPPETTDLTTEAESTTSYVQPTMSELAPGCFYGEKTGTDQTLTGLQPLPLNPFSTASFPDPETFSTKTIEHSYGVATDEKAHSISVNNQQFFDNGGYNALCLDTKTQEKVLYLTFDCGYENGYTAKILDTLRDKGVKAAFFCTLPQMKENGTLIARMINEGHIVGNHSVTHPDFSSLSRQEMLDEIKGFDDYLRQNFGYSALYFRYPQGKYSEASLDLINSVGYKCVFWSLAYADWDLNNQKGADYALQTVVSRLHPGAVMLLHAVSPDNANALADIIDTAREMGYTFRALSDYGT